MSIPRSDKVEASLDIDDHLSAEGLEIQGYEVVPAGTTPPKGTTFAPSETALSAAMRKAARAAGKDVPDAVKTFVPSISVLPNAVGSLVDIKDEHTARTIRRTRVDTTTATAIAVRAEVLAGRADRKTRNTLNPTKPPRDKYRDDKAVKNARAAAARHREMLVDGHTVEAIASPTPLAATNEPKVGG